MTNKMIEEIEDIHLSDPNPCFKIKICILYKMKINDLINKNPVMLYAQLKM